MLARVTQLFTGALWLSFLLLGSGCSKAKEDAKPIAANTLQFTVGGKQLVFPVALTSAVLSQQGKHWEITGTTNPSTASTGSSIALYINSTSTTLEAPGVYAAPAVRGQPTVTSVYGLVVPNGTQNACGTYVAGYITYQTFTNPSHEQFELRIQSVDTGQHTVSGTFSGIYYKGCDQLTISDGQFNLPYVSKP